MNILRKASSASEQRKSFNNVVEIAKQNSDSSNKNITSENSSSDMFKTSVSFVYNFFQKYKLLKIQKNTYKNLLFE